jgi:signal transduction histidine kinase/CheY-like chemotaxis protein
MTRVTVKSSNADTASRWREFSGSIAGRLAMALIILGITATIITTVVQTYREYRAEITLINARFENIRKSHGPSLAASVWHYSERQIELELQGILNTPGLQYAEVTSPQGPIWQAGLKSSSDVITAKFPLIFSHNGKEHGVGTLTVMAGQQVIYDSMISHAVESLSYFGIWTFVLAGSLFMIFRQLVTRHLSALARYTSSMSFDGLTSPFVLERTASKRGSADELDQVANAINAMQSQLADSVRNLHESERRLRRLFENAEVSIWNEDFSEVIKSLDELRRDGISDLRHYLTKNPEAGAELAKQVKVLQVNEATLKLFGAEDQDRLLYRIHETFGLDADEVFMDELCAIWDGQRVFRSEATFQALDGREINAIITFQIPETKAGFRSVPVIVIDITERKILEEQVRRSQKMDAMGQLTGGIAHDFNNILGIVMGNLDLVRERAKNDPNILRFADAALSGTKRGADITRKLLVFSGQRPGITESMLANDSVLRLQEFIAKSLTASINVETHLADDLWPVDIIPGDLEDVILNLSLNARDAMPDGGTLVIETANHVFDDTSVGYDLSAKAGNFVMISVSDNGAGMTAEVKERIFEPFFSTKDTGKGTGLGLSMVYGFVQRSGGHIMVYSELGAGTTFRIFLPRGRQETTPVIETTDRSAALPRGLETILIVEDEASLLDVAATHLEALGYKTVTAINGKDALQILQTRQDIDLMFCDVIMPGDLDGYQLALAAHQIYPTLKILMTSGFTKRREEHAETKDDYLAGLTRDLLSKPYSVQNLALSIRRALDGH